MASGDRGQKLLRAPEIDAELHDARVDGRGGKVTYEARLGSLPGGTFVEVEGGCRLVWGGGLRLWSPEGYGQLESGDSGLLVTVLTPKPVVDAIREGFAPQIHEIANR